jgi:1-aminocyclopropane-1-carboxylate synthase
MIEDRSSHSHLTDTALSLRANRLLSNPPMDEYMREHFSRCDQPWHGESLPDGYVALCIAENKLVAGRLLDKMSSYHDIPARVLGYDAMVGSIEFREQLASFMGRTFLGRTFDPQQLAVLAGGGTVLEILFYVIADPGDTVLVPTPSYAGYWADLETRDELRIAPVHTSSADGFRLTVELLDAAYDAAETPVRALLYTNPDNPTGRITDPDEIGDIVAWTESKGIHLIWNEVYALSVFGTKPFTSIATVLPDLGDRVHVVWAFSKDFGASGLRCGVLVSENEELLDAVDGLAYWGVCSGDTQYRLGESIADEEWVDGFLADVRDSLGNAYRRVTAELSSLQIPFVPADGGIFVLCDFRSFMDEVTWEAEDALWRHLLHRANVNLTPGSACRIGEPGFMRLCYASESTDAVLAGLERVGAVLGGKRPRVAG